MRAIVSSPANGIYTVIFYYVVEATNRRDYTKPIIEVPCNSYKHACDTVEAYNR